ncbi:MAG: sigma-70 family RNA polymerase sigma factor [Deltaproteobacteria bacterium]|nr:sigma-70 family RNA polymerase sigma factor [Deltaproteobacteria bacterium]
MTRPVTVQQIATRPPVGRAAARAEQGVATGSGVVQLDVESLYRRYGDMVLGRCRTLLGNDSDAQEACQEVFLRLHRYRDAFRGDASPSTYLFKITTSTCLNKRRTRTRRREDSSDEPLVIACEDSALASHHVRDLVERVLAVTDERTRLAVVHHYVDGMTYDEVGALLGLSGAAIRKRVAQFKAQFRDNPPAWLAEVSE